MIKARVIIDGVGPTEEAVVKGLKEVVASMRDLGFSIEEENFGTPERVADDKCLDFVELLIEFKDFRELFDLILKRDPKSVEILEPEEFSLSKEEVEYCLNELISTNRVSAKTLKTLANATVSLRREVEKLRGKIKEESFVEIR